jgi:hypothetical protein
VKSGEIAEETPVAAKTKPSADFSGYVPADTSSLGLPPVTSKPRAAANETPAFQTQESEHPQPIIPTAQPKSATQKIKFLGGNNKKIAFIVNCPTDVFLPEKHLDWLGKMLTACQLNLGDVAIVNIANNQHTITDINQELQSQTIILLGAEPYSIQLPLNFPHFSLQPYANTMFLYTPSPDQLNQNTQEAKLLKSKLWVCLQKLFKL